MPKTKTPLAQDNTTQDAGLEADVQSVLSLAHDAGLEVEEQSAFYKIARDRKAVYVSKSKRTLARIDLAGFAMQHPAVVPVSAEEAKAKKLGKVRGQIFPKATDQDWLNAVTEAFRILNDGTPGIKFQKGLAAVETDGEESEELAADRPRPRRRANRTSRIPVL